MPDQKEVLRRAIRALQAALEKLEAEDAVKVRTRDSAPAPKPRYAYSTRWCEQHQKYEAVPRGK